MPNLAGTYMSGRADEESEKTLRRQLHSIESAGIEHDEHRYVEGCLGMGLLQRAAFGCGQQPARDRQRRFGLLIDGEITNLEEIRRRFASRLGESERSMPEICLALLIEFGPRIAAEFSGAFIIALHDAESRSLTLISDRLGIRPLFVRVSGSTCDFATEVKGLLAVAEQQPSIDGLGLLELFGFGNHVFGRTWLQGIRRLSPATILEVSEKGANFSTYFAYRYDEQAPKLDHETYSAVYGKLVDRSVERNMRGDQRKGLFLSGGYDSRAIAGAIQPHHLPVSAVTFGVPSSRDVLYAAEIARRKGFEHTVIEPKSPYLYAHAPSIAWRTEGMIPFANTTSIAYHARIAERMDVILAGFLGEFSGSHVWPGLLLARSRQQAIDSIFDRFVGRRMSILSRIFDERFLERHVSELRHFFAESFEPIDNDHPINVADSWNFRYLHPQETYQAPAVDRHRFELRTPLTDKELVDFLLTIPPFSRLEQRVYKSMIYHSYPELQDVPCTNSAMPIDPNFGREYLKMIARYGIRQAARPLYWLRKESALQAREFRNLADDFRSEPELLSGFIEPMLQDDVFPSGIFNHAAIRSVAAEHYDRKHNHEDVLSTLIGWGLAARALLHQDHRGIATDLLPG